MRRRMHLLIKSYNSSHYNRHRDHCRYRGQSGQQISLLCIYDFEPPEWAKIILLDHLWSVTVRCLTLLGSSLTEARAILISRGSWWMWFYVRC